MRFELLIIHTVEDRFIALTSIIKFCSLALQDGVVTTEERYALKRRGKKSVRALFNHIPRSPRKKPFYVHIRLRTAYDIGQNVKHRIVIEVREDLVPLTAEYFRRLCDKGWTFDIFHKGLEYCISGDFEDEQFADTEEDEEEEWNPHKQSRIENHVLARSYGSVWFGTKGPGRWPQLTLVIQGNKEVEGYRPVSSVFGRVVIGLAGFEDLREDGDFFSITWDNFRVTKVVPDPPSEESVWADKEASRFSSIFKNFWYYVYLMVPR